MKGFSDKLISWYQINKRDLPWRQTNDPYKVWLSEIMLQQTRVDQGMSYYLKFIKDYPNINKLAKASEDHVLANWQGLGYYSRARNLHATAKYISEELNGVFPNTHKEILQLKGVGPYTAAAIASFCFKEVEPVVDGNVLRVMTRFMGVEEPINKPFAQKKVKEFCKQVIPKQEPDVFNQAIMEFGALHCKPKKPDCTHCIFASGCKAYEENKVSSIPYKERNVKRSTRYFDYFFFYTKSDIWIRKRNQKGIWLGLHEGLLLEEVTPLPENEILNLDHLKPIKETQKNKLNITYTINRAKHILSHQDLFIKYWFIEIENNPKTEKKLKKEGLFKIKFKALEKKGFPIVTKHALDRFKEDLLVLK